ncbi:laccase-25-like [Ananas comosus]|uniref:laccase n=1 Tax=Ananas comosus TaxID=4615 RepID=A0A6P5EFW7_ANACO|nr:laccase-25-like [Ananas comosus]
MRSRRRGRGAAAGQLSGGVAEAVDAVVHILGAVADGARAGAGSGGMAARRATAEQARSALTARVKRASSRGCGGRRRENYMLEVEYGKTYLLRIINAALDNQFFYKVASHNFTVVSVDATYTKPYKTDVIVIAPGQTVDAIMVADSTPARYYMVAHPYASENPQPSYFKNTTTRGILQYKSASLSSSPMVPLLPPLHDTPTAHRFYTSLTSLLLPGQPTVPLHVDECMFVSFGLGSLCKGGEQWCELTDRMIVASMNNVLFRLPTKMSMLEAHFKGIQGVFTTDFPNKPPLFFDFTNASLHNGTIEESLEITAIGTMVKKLKYNSTVEIVLQSTAIVATQNHPMHIHGFNFFVLAQGFGNYNEQTARNSYNLVDPQVRNTIAIPTGGWAVIRFIANNPGVWFMHCHMDLHFPMGLATTFLVENGPTPDTTLPPPPADFPQCSSLEVARSESIWNQDKSEGKDSYL